MNKRFFTQSVFVTALIAASVVLAVMLMRPTYSGTRAGKADENYIPSTECRTCHVNEHTSWSATHHSKMTQDVKSSIVQGDFERDRSYEFDGVRAVMERRGGSYFMTLNYPDGKVEVNEILRTVGSRRIEQYLTKRNGQYYRLPVAFDIERQRWMHLSGSFFYPDGQDFNRHTVQWDTNCVFCHNVKAQPNFDFRTRMANTEVAELGIACGACHGQGAEHAEEAGSPANRFRWSLNENSDKSIVQPRLLDTDRSTMICGHCHGQRIPDPTDRIREILSHGDPYDAGEDLSKFYKSVSNETQIGHISFSNRFWPDGSPRLTAYEYQGLTSSKCFTAGEPGNRISCLSCHTMHTGDAKGQLTEEMRTNSACTQCHTELNDGPRLAGHTKHAPTSQGSSCYSCHMPEVVYGVMSFHPTHKITVPDPRNTLQNGTPNACNQCHVDKSLNWSIEQAAALWPGRPGGAGASPKPEHETAEAVRGLFAGDSLTRAMMADAIRKHGAPEWGSPWLLASFESDNYPIVRFFAANGLSQWNRQINPPDYLATRAVREEQLAQWIRSIGPAEIEGARAVSERLRKLRSDVDIEVGE